MMETNNHGDRDDDALLFADEPGELTRTATLPDGLDEAGWTVLVVDDDESIHLVTRMVLSGLRFKDQPVHLYSAYSAAQGKQLLQQHPDAAVMLLDVVMESDHAGLEMVKYIREQIDNALLRIILRTGQAGMAPEHEVISNYDINDYKDKSELTAQKLRTSVIAALRAYDDLTRIQRLVQTNEQLEQLVGERTAALSQAHTQLQLEFAERLRMLESLRVSQALLQEAQRIARIGNFEYNLASGEMKWSDQIYAMLQVSPQQMVPSLTALLAGIPEDQRGQIDACIQHALQAGEPYMIEHTMALASGEHCQVRQQGDLIRNAAGEQVLLGILQDISEQYQAEQTMRKLSAAVEQTADAVMITNLAGSIEYVNPAFVQMTGFPREEAIGKTPAILRSDKQNPTYYRQLWNTILSGEVFSDVLINRRKDGRLYYEEKTITPQRDKAGVITHFISTGKDITERMKHQERLYYMAHHDVLTGLPNRLLLLERIDQAMSRSRWHQRQVAVLFLDLDRFKVINDTLGHDVGDRLLIEMAKRLSTCVRDGDTVARLGGDEFAIVLNDIRDARDIALVAEKLLEVMKIPVLIDDRELFMTTSIGISTFPADGETSHQLLKKADVAMYYSKAKGKNCYSFYTSESEHWTTERLGLESLLRRALERDQFELHYQPQVDIRQQRVKGIEALLRWHHPDGLAVSPYQFIPILEESGMIVPVGEWVLRRACEQERARQAAGLAPLRVAVNLSVHQFRQGNLTTLVERVLSDTGLAPQYLELEVTEGVLVDNFAKTAKCLHELHELGVSLAIDDFGTGYSSMNYLRRLPFDLLKIDRSFIVEATRSPDDAAIVTAIIGLSQALGMEVIAEGVEFTEQLRFLRAQGCHQIQGYLCSPPRPMHELMAMMADEQSSLLRAIQEDGNVGQD